MNPAKLLAASGYRSGNPLYDLANGLTTGTPQDILSGVFQPQSENLPSYDPYGNETKRGTYVPVQQLGQLFTSLLRR